MRRSSPDAVLRITQDWARLNPGLLLTGLRLLIGVILLTSGTLKLVNQQEFTEALKTFEIFSPRSIDVLALVVPHVEAALGIFLVFDLKTRLLCSILVMFLVSFSSLGAMALIAGRSVDCGCFPVVGTKEPIGALFLIRNGVLILLCLQVALGGRHSHRKLYAEIQSE